MSVDSSRFNSSGAIKLNSGNRLLIGVSPLGS
jgi:hypothetical protein